MEGVLFSLITPYAAQNAGMGMVTAQASSGRGSQHTFPLAMDHGLAYTVLSCDSRVGGRGDCAVVEQLSLLTPGRS